MARKPESDWRQETLERMRGLIMDAVPEMIEERKWKKPSNGMTMPPCRSISPRCRMETRCR